MTPLRASAGAERGGWIAAGIAIAARLGVAAWASGRFPASADGFYYDTLARRLASGHGYTWLWPDGAVTNVAHYPVGYPALLALAYLALGARPLAAMILNAIFGGATAYGVYHLASERAASRASATIAAMAVALHPALVPYAAAVMTEGIAAALAVVAVAVACAGGRRSWKAWLGAGLVLGVATLVRPQSLAFAPLLGALAPAAPARWKTRALAALVVTAATLAVCAPWTARNCVAMRKCSLVSENGGWNLLIGAQTTSGAWQPADVPEECRTVWDEAGKDECFGAAARRTIAGAPLAWLARAPAKVAVTFDYLGAGPWYLHEANPAAFDDHAKLALGIVETVVTYVFLLAALARAGLSPGPRRALRLAILGAGLLAAAVWLHGWIAYAALAAAIGAFGPRWLVRAPLLVPWTAVAIALTAATHAVFFGAGRYGLVVVPFVTALAFVRLRASEA